MGTVRRRNPAGRPQSKRRSRTQLRGNTVSGQRRARRTDSVESSSTQETVSRATRKRANVKRRRLRLKTKPGRF